MTLIEADIRALERKKRTLEDQIARMSRAVAVAPPHIASLQVSADIKLLEKKRTTLLSEIERLTKQVKPLTARLEAMRGEIETLALKLKELKTDTYKAQEAYDEVVAATKAYQEKKIEEITTYKNGVLRETVAAYEKMAEDRKALDAESEALHRQEETVSKLGREYALKLQEIDGERRIVENEKQRAKDAADKAASYEMETKRLIDEARERTDKAKEDIRSALEAADTIERRANELFRQAVIASSKNDRISAQNAEEAKQLKDKEDELKIIERQLQDRAETLKRGFAELQSKHGK